MNEFSLTNCAILEKDIKEALDSIAVKHRLKEIVAYDVLYTSYNMSFKIKAQIDSDVDRELLVKTALRLNLPSEFLDKTYLIQNKSLRIIGFQANLKPVVLEDINSGERFCLSVKNVMKAETVTDGGAAVESPSEMKYSVKTFS